MRERRAGSPVAGRACGAVKSRVAKGGEKGIFRYLSGLQTRRKKGI